MSKKKLLEALKYIKEVAEGSPKDSPRMNIIKKVAEKVLEE